MARPVSLLYSPRPLSCSFHHDPIHLRSPCTVCVYPCSFYLQIGVPVVLWDERHTTRLARAVLDGTAGEAHRERHGAASGWVTLPPRGPGGPRAAAASAAARAAPVDDVAAEMLLDSFAPALLKEVRRARAAAAAAAPPRPA